MRPPSDHNHLKTLVGALAVAIAIGALLGQTVFSQGDLTPTGPPAPTMKTLSQIEPRTLISSLPFTVTAPGSYYLTANLNGSPSTDGITIEASGVTIDLNGFVLTGSGSDSGHGIFQSDADYDSAIIKNGSVTNWLGDEKAGLQLNGKGNRVQNILGFSNNLAIFTGAGAVIKDCTARDNGGTSTIAGGGIFAGAGSVVSSCAAYDNQVPSAGIGIFCGEGSTIEGCIAANNQFAGSSGTEIGGSDGSVIRNCVAYGNSGANGFTGIFVTNGGEISGCSSYNNTVAGGLGAGIVGGDGTIVRDSSVKGNTTDGSQGIGIGVGSGGYVIGCTVTDQGGTAPINYGIFTLFKTSMTGCNVSNNAGIGIKVAEGCVVRRNVCNGNGGIGIEVVQSGSTIDGNVMNGNLVGLSIVTKENVVTSNRATGNATGDYAIAAGNTFGPIVSVLGVGDLSAVANADHPQANFSD